VVVSHVAPEVARHASFLRAGIAMGLLSTHDAIAWADELVARHDAVPPGVLALSLAPPHDEVRVRELLGDLAFTTFGERESADVIGALLDLLREELVTGRRSHAGVVSVLGHAGGALPLEHDLKLALFMHHADFASSGGSTVYENRTRALLAPFEGARLAFMPAP
jgi:hypothetical protein